MVEYYIMVFNSVENPIYADPSTHEFLKDGIAEGAHLRIPNGIYSKTWVRERNIIFCYYGARAYDSDIARIYRTPVWEITKTRYTAVMHFWGNCSPELQARYPWESILLNKSLPLKSVDESNPVLEKWGREHYQETGRKGGQSANKVLSTEQRSEMGKKGAQILLEKRGTEHMSKIGKKGGGSLKGKYGDDYHKQIREGKKFKTS